jgi:hypothetical protein
MHEVGDPGVPHLPETVEAGLEPALEKAPSMVRPVVEAVEAPHPGEPAVAGLPCVPTTTQPVG